MRRGFFSEFYTRVCSTNDFLILSLNHPHSPYFFTLLQSGGDSDDTAAYDVHQNTPYYERDIINMYGRALVHGGEGSYTDPTEQQLRTYYVDPNVHIQSDEVCLKTVLYTSTFHRPVAKFKVAFTFLSVFCFTITFTMPSFPKYMDNFIMIFCSVIQPY